SEEHTSELQSLTNIVCRLLLEKKRPGTDATWPTAASIRSATSRALASSSPSPSGRSIDAAWPTTISPPSDARTIAQFSSPASAPRRTTRDVGLSAALSGYVHARRAFGPAPPPCAATRRAPVPAAAAAARSCSSPGGRLVFFFCKHPAPPQPPPLPIPQALRV